jgi:hypothetical protein
MILKEEVTPYASLDSESCLVPYSIFRVKYCIRPLQEIHAPSITL